MKKILLLLAIIFPSIGAMAQVPQAITYQAVARNASGSAIVNSGISLRISIKDVNATGPTLYSETHSVTTNQFGLFTLAVGTGLVQSGNFSNINWAAGSKFMKVEMDPNGGSNYIDMGTSQLLSVPYALMAGSLIGGGGGDDWGTQTATTNTTLSGNGTGASPLGIAQQGAATGQVLKWNGSTWVPSSDLIGSSGGDNWGTQTVVTNSALTGGGTFASPLGLAQQGAANGQVLKWNGATWAPANDIDNDAQSLSFTGNTLTISNGNSVTLPTQINYSAGAGINIAGNVISNTGDLSSTNELQTLSIAANQLTISNGNSVVLPSTNYTAGTGINISGSVISNSSPDQIVTITGTGSASVTSTYPNFTINATDAQTLSLAGTTISISNGNSVTLPSQLNYTSGTGINITGTVISNSAPDQLVSLNGTGATTVTGAYPNFTIHSVDNDAQTLSLSGTTISISNGNSVTLPAQLNYTSGSGIGIAGTVISNSAPDQIVSLNGTGGASVTGSYPNFTVNSTDNDAQTLTLTGNVLDISNGNSVTLPAQLNYTAGTGIGIAGTVITNSLPDQIVSLIGTGGTTVTGAYPNFTINSTDIDTDSQTLSIAGNSLSILNGNTVTLPAQTPYTAGTGIGIAGTVITNSAPDQIVSLTGTGSTTVTGAYPNFTINSTDTDTDAQTLSIAGNSLSILNGNTVTLPSGNNYTAGTGISIGGTVITNLSPDQIVSLTGTGMSTVTGAYPNFTVNSVATADATLSGNGTAGTPLKIAQQGATNGQTLKWNGATWLPANDIDVDAQTLSIAGNILTISNGNNVTLPTGTTYTAGSGINLTGTVFSNNALTDLTLAGNGTIGTPLKIAQQAATNGQVLKWNGASWLPANDIDAQTLSLAGNILTISNGNNVTLPAQTTYSAGSGISLTGTTFSNNAITDATLSGNGTVGTPLKIAQQGANNGDVLQWNGTTWIPTTLASVISLGQSTTSVFGNLGLPVPVNSAFTVVPGLTQTINVPAGYSAFVTTGGGVQTSSASAGGYSVVDIIISIDGAMSPNGGYQRVIIGNSVLTSSIAYWAMHLSPVLVPGIHTINVQASGPNQGGAVPCTVSGNNTSVLQGELTITLIKN